MNIKNYLIWILMWVCDMVPWVSGGTIALIMWVYERLLSAISSTLDIKNVRIFFAWNVSELRKKIDWWFLLLLWWWILTSVLVFSRVFEHLIQTHPHLVWWFFLWLVIASILVLLKRHWTISFEWVSIFLLWIVVAYIITLSQTVQVNPNRWYIILAASIAISAMILPGISWSFLLLILWMYTPLLTAINNWDFMFLWLFAVWAVLGLAIFSRVISYFLHTYYDKTLALLIGFMTWALPVLWPWQNSNGKLFEKVVPEMYQTDPQIILVLGIICVWFFWAYRVFNNFVQVK